MKSDKYILLTIDVEDWFQVENFKPWIPFSSWDQCELRVEKNTHRLLNLFDSIELKAHSSKLKGKGADDRSQMSEVRGPKTESNGDQMVDHGKHPSSLRASHPQAADYELSATRYEKSHPKATFFILGWIAEKLPHLVREIHDRGHEVASHGYNHELCSKLPANELKKDLIDSKKLLEDIIGMPVTGYRAPSFSINDDILKTLQDCGYLYDSSYNSFGMHSRYGHLDLSQNGTRGIAFKISQIPNPKSQIFYELPVSNLQFGGLTFPLGGGGYFRLIPVSVFNSGVKKILWQQDAYVFYAHPWELDPEQPKVIQASFSFKFRHYTNLYKTETRLINLIESFDYCRFVTCSEYLNAVQGHGMKKIR